MNNTQPTFQVGDIVICSRRRQGLIYRVLEVHTELWTTQHHVWNQCTQAQIGTPYQVSLRIQSIFDLTMTPRDKPRKVGFTASLWQCTKIEPQQVADLMQRLDKFLVETWP